MADTFTVAYHPEQQSVVEFRDQEGVLVADLPDGRRTTHRGAAAILNACVSDDDVLVRDVEKGASTPKNYKP
jgi:hypothetical protein